MAQPNNWKYCRQTTEAHSLAKNHPECLLKIHDIILNEGAKNSPFSAEETAINLDHVATLQAQKAGRAQQSTMDMAFGIIGGSKKQFVLCEFKLRVKKPENLKKDELTAKISSSKALLGHETVIHQFYLFVFSTHIKNQAHNRLRRLYANKPHVKALDLNDLKQDYFS